MKWLDLHYGNVGVALPTLNDHYIGDILDYFGIPECIIVFPQQHPLRPEALPPYLLSPVSIIDYLTKKDPTFHKAPLRAEILDLGNGQFSKSGIMISVDMTIYISSYFCWRDVPSFCYPNESLRT